MIASYVSNSICMNNCAVTDTYERKHAFNIISIMSTLFDKTTDQITLWIKCKINIVVWTITNSVNTNYRKKIRVTKDLNNMDVYMVTTSSPNIIIFIKCWHLSIRYNNRKKLYHDSFIKIEVKFFFA